MQFELVVKNDKVKYYKLIALFLVLLHAAVFIFLLVAGVHPYQSAAALLVMGIYLIYLLYITKKNGRIFFISPVTFFILAISWTMLRNYLLMFGCISLGVLYYLSLQNIGFVFNKDFIKKMNFPKKIYYWEMLSNVVLKDNILTIDFKNNTLIQLEIESSINETQFNEFANQQLLKIRV